MSDATLAPAGQQKDIISACFSGDLDTVRRILAEDPSQANSRDSFLGSTPLIIATHRGYREIAEALIAAGADVNAREQVSNTTALHWAAEAGQPELVRLLLHHGAEMDVTDDWYALGPVGWAVIVNFAPQYHKQRPETADLLVGLGFWLDPFSAIHRNELGSLREMIRLEHGIVNTRLGFAGKGYTPLHYAAEHGKADAVRILIKSHADVSACTDWGVSPIALAALNGHKQIEQMLFDANALHDLSYALLTGDMQRAKDFSPGREQQFLIHQCAELGLAPAIDQLAGQGADVHAQAPYLLCERRASVTPLHVAASNGKDQAVRALLRHGADPNAVAEATGDTPLHCAARLGHLEAVRALLEAGADRSRRDKLCNSTAYEAAEHSNHRAVAELLSA